MAPRQRSRRTCCRVSRGRGRTAVWRSILPLRGRPGLRAALLAALLAGISAPAFAETYRLEVTADTSIAAHPNEVTHNLGGSSRIRIKGIQHLMLMKFGLTPVRGMTVSSAVLRVRSASERLWLKTVGLSTISADWPEGTARGEPQEGAVCFQYAAFPDKLWAGPQSDFTDVTFGVGNTLCAYTDIRELGDGWVEVDVPPELVQAMICGDSYGLVLSDEKGQTMANNDVYSREQSASRPYLTVEAERTDTQPPEPPDAFVIEPAPEFAHLNSGAIRLNFRAPRDRGPSGAAFTYIGEVGATSSFEDFFIPRYLIPHAAGPGEAQEIVIGDLRPSAPFVVRFCAIDGAWNTSEWVEAEGHSSPALPLPELTPTEAEAKTPEAPREAWVCPSVVKVNPQTLSVLEEVGRDGYGGIWEGQLARSSSRFAGKSVRLLTGRNGFASFQVVLEVRSEPAEATVRLGPFECDRGKTLSPGNVELFRVWYVKDGEHWYPEVAIPTDGTIQLPAADNAIPDQRSQAVWVDLHVPLDATVGEHRSAVEVVLGDDTHRLPITLHVIPVTYPDELNLNLDLNGYGPVGRHFGLDNASAEYHAVEREYHRLAHRHRATLDLLGYSHSGNISANYAPPVEGRGADTRITDWSSWDEQFGPYLSGEAFSDLPRAGVPLHNLYLWLHEDWPPPIEEYYNAPEVSAEYPLMIAEHAMRARPIEEAFSEAHREAFRTVSRQIAEHFADRGWTRTDLQCYLNNKHYYKAPDRGGRGTCWRLLDEPSWRDDFLALGHFGRLFKEGTAGTEGPPMIYREDLSRPQWQRQWLRDVIDLMVISGELSPKNRRCLEMQRENGAAIWNYGTANVVGESNLEAVRWVLRAYLAGADAIVLWNTIGSDGSYEKAEPTAILYPGKRFGIQGPVASLRLKVLREAAQDVEALIMLGKKRGWNREQLAAAIMLMRGQEIEAGALSVQPWDAANGLTVKELHGVRGQVLAELAERD